MLLLLKRKTLTSVEAARHHVINAQSDVLARQAITGSCVKVGWGVDVVLTNNDNDDDDRQ